jgi:anaerobic selenocysteine-containing dehydrogenase
MPTLRSACPLDCPDLCSLSVEVDGDRVTRLDGSALNPLTEGFICAKVRSFPQHMYGPARLTSPLIRAGAKGGGRFRSATWEEALALVAARLAEVRARHGGEAILPYSYGGCNGWLTEGVIDERLWRRLGASRLLRTFCAEPTGAAAAGLYGRMPGVALEDYAHAQLIVVWGCNPHATGVHLVPIVRQAQAAGAALVVIDPRRTKLARSADLHLAPRVGTDLPLALSVIDWLFANGRADEGFLAAHTRDADALRARAAEWPTSRAAAVCDVPAADLARFAALYAERSPAVIRVGWGQERNRNGGSSSAAIMALPAVAGKLGVRGGGYTSSNSRAFGLSAEPAIASPPVATRIVNMTQLGAALTELQAPRICALFVYDCNPAATAPEQRRVLAGLARDDLFTVVYDQVHTDTCDYADVILPATTFLEHRELRNGYGAMRLFDSPAVAAPVGESRPNYEVFLELLDRLGLSREGDPRTADDLAAALLDSAPDAPALRARLATAGIAAPVAGATPVQMVDVFPRTASRQIELCPPALDPAAPAGLYRFQPDPATTDYPLALISPASSRTISSTFGQLVRRPAEVEINRADAEARGIASGDPVRIHNRRGEVLCVARVTDDIRPGVASLAKGLWRRHTGNGLTANALCPDTEADLGRGACYNDARVEITRAS